MARGPYSICEVLNSQGGIPQSTWVSCPNTNKLFPKLSRPHHILPTYWLVSESQAGVAEGSNGAYPSALPKIKSLIPDLPFSAWGLDHPHFRQQFIFQLKINEKAQMLYLY